MMVIKNREYFENNSLIRKYPKYRNNFINGCWRWLEGKRADDEAYEYWRVHDKLYDLTDFIDSHPGGKTWLQLTKGTDITEAFESFHLSEEASKTLEKYYVYDAPSIRNYRYTYNDNDFYKTLKRNICEKMKSVDFSVTGKSKRYHDFTLFAFFIAIIFVNKVESNEAYFFWVILAGQLLAWLVTISHNFLHKADNWRMYSGNLALMTSRDLRIYHILSHHMYPNTYADLEVTTFEPYYKWIPILEKRWLYKFHLLAVTINTHLVYFHNVMKMRFFGFFWSSERAIYWDELVMYIVPIIMILTDYQAITYDYLYDVFFKWVHVMIATNVFYVSFFINRGHHLPHVTHQGDQISSYDFGKYQISATAEHTGSNSNMFTTLTFYGEQILHQLFPTIDAAVLPQLKATLINTCKEYNIELKKYTIIESVVGQYRQLLRTDVNVDDNKKQK